MKETQITFAEIEPSFYGPGKEMDECIIVSNDTKGELIRITPRGEVIAPSLEKASEAGRVFVDAVRSVLKQSPLNN